MHSAPNLDIFHLWFESIRYGVANLQNYSIQARDTLFMYANLNTDEAFTPETNIVSRFTVTVNFLTPNDPLYRKVTSNVLAAKEKAYIVYGSKLTRRVEFTTPPKSAPERPEPATAITPTSNVEAILLNLTSAITENSSKTMTSTEREHASEAKEYQSFYEILFANIIEETNEDGTVTTNSKKQDLKAALSKSLRQTRTARQTESSNLPSKLSHPKCTTFLITDSHRQAISKPSCLISPSQQQFGQPHGPTNTPFSNQKE